MEKGYRAVPEFLQDRVVSAEEAATWIENGMTLGLSGFTRAVMLKRFHTPWLKELNRSRLK